MNKDQRIKLAQETLQIIADDHYCPPGKEAGYNLAVTTTRLNTVYYDPETPPRYITEVSFTDQTTLEAARELTATGRRLGVLNFASGKNPGGGFLRGTSAQEESLAYASTLYASLSSRKAAPYYAAHRKAKDPKYSHRMIFSPVTVFRDDHGNLLSDPYQIRVLTAAAPNRREMERGDVQEQEIRTLIERRIHRALYIFADQGCDTLVLGAWGCGVFGNEPYTVANAFFEALYPCPYRNRFRQVRFAIHGSQQNLDAFSERFDIEPCLCPEVHEHSPTGHELVKR